MRKLHVTLSFIGFDQLEYNAFGEMTLDELKAKVTALEERGAQMIHATTEDGCHDYMYCDGTWHIAELSEQFHE